MAQPTKFVPSYDFSDFQTASPNAPLPGAQVDTQLGLVKTTTDQIIDNLGLIQRDDGALANNSVGNDQLSPEVTVGLRPVGDWLTETAYTVNDAVWEDDTLYRCAVTHTSGTFATDLTAGKWVELLDFSVYAGAGAEAEAAAAAAVIAQEAAELAQTGAETAEINAETAETNAEAAAIAAANSAASAAAAVSGYDWKQSVRVASVVDVTIASPGAEINGIGLDADDRVLLKNQSTASQNGIWVWNGAAVPMTRADDADADGKMTFGMSLFVQSGTHSNQQWTLTTHDPITVGTTALTFAQTASASGVAATTAAAGVVELATQAELDTGTDTERAVTPNILAKHLERELVVALGDETTAITTGDGKVTFRAPFAMTLSKLPRASLVTASSSGAVTLDIREAGTTIFSTALTIDQDEKTSTTATTPAALSDTSIADDAEIAIDIDGAGVGAAGLKVTFFYRRT